MGDFYYLPLGYLQVQFLANSLNLNIQQHSQFDYCDSYNNVVVRSNPTTNLTIYIIWVKFQEQSKKINHICPLIPKSSKLFATIVPLFLNFLRIDI